MPRFRKKPAVVEAVTFDELVAYGRAHGANIVNGMPWSFSYRGHPVTHENDDCYLLPPDRSGRSVRMERGDMLVTDEDGKVYPCKPDVFAATYEPVPPEEPRPPHPPDLPESGVQLIAKERTRQINGGRWTAANDAAHADGALALAAAAYALQHTVWRGFGHRLWPWLAAEWKPRDTVRNLERAGALIAAEIDRLNRLPDPSFEENLRRSGEEVQKILDAEPERKANAERAAQFLDRPREWPPRLHTPDPSAPLTPSFVRAAPVPDPTTDPTTDLNPTPDPSTNPLAKLPGLLASLWGSLAGKRTIILSAVLAVVKAVLPLVPAGGTIAAILTLLDQLIPVLIPVTLHAAIQSARQPA